MSFHSNLIQSFQNFKDLFIGSNDISDLGDGTLTGAITEVNDSKQDVLTFDDVPTQNSNNPVKSGGVYTALQNVDIDVDSSLSSTSENPVQNKVIKGALDLKQNTLTFDSTPTINSSNPVTSGGVFTALQNVEIDVDSALSSTSENPVQNKVVKGALDSKQDTLTAGTGITIDSNNTISADGGGAEIDDTTTSSSTVWSSSKVNTAIEAKTEIDDTSTGLTKTWSASKLQATFAAINSLKKEIVVTLPTENIDPNTIYLVPSSSSTTDDYFDEFLYINNRWELLGSTRVDLTNYYTSTQVDTLLSGKQNSLTFDSTPTENSTNPVTSGGIFTALQNVDIDIDDELDDESTNPVQNAVVTSAINDKQDSLIAGTNIVIEDNIISATSGTLYWDKEFPTS